MENLWEQIRRVHRQFADLNCKFRFIRVLSHKLLNKASYLFHQKQEVIIDHVFMLGIKLIQKFIDLVCYSNMNFELGFQRYHSVKICFNLQKLLVQTQIQLINQSKVGVIWIRGVSFKVLHNSSNSIFKTFNHWTGFDIELLSIISHHRKQILIIIVFEESPGSPYHIICFGK